MVESISLDQILSGEPEEVAHGGCGSCGTGKALASLVKCGNGLEKIYPTTAVRFGFLRYIGEFSHAPDMKFTCGAKVVIQTKRGMEIGEQVSLTCHGCDKSVTRDAMRRWVDTCGEDAFIFDAGRILREATAADLAEFARIQGSNRTKRDVCRELAARHRLPMKVVECESLFGGERIIFFFMAEERVDFRELVKELAGEYRTRIEMRQVGARDEARLLADYETCGREVCCKVFLKTLRPISMRMAKLQKATLDPTQVSGRCGRLKCCLRYEHTGYEELDKQLPRLGLRIRTSHGDGVIINRQVLTQLVQIRKDDNTLLTVVAEDVLEVGVLPPERPEAPDTEIEDGRPGDRRRPPRPEGRMGGRDPRSRRGGDLSRPAGPPAPREEEATPGDTTDGPAAPKRDSEEEQRQRRDRGRRRRGRRRGGNEEGGGAFEDQSGAGGPN